MVSLEEAVYRLKKKNENLAGDSASISLARLYALEEVAEAANVSGSRPACEQVHNYVLKACLDLLKSGVGRGVASSIRRVLGTLWGWLDHNTIVSGHGEIISIITSSTKDKKYPQILTSCLEALTAAYDATKEQGVEGIIGTTLLDAFSSSIPQLDKMPDATSKVRCMQSLSKCLGVTVASGVSISPLKEESKAIKQIQRALKDKDMNVRNSGYRCMTDASRCVNATGTATPAYDCLLNAAIKGLEERCFTIKKTASVTVASLLYTAFAQHQSDAAAGKSEDSKRKFGIRKRRSLGGTVLGLKFLRELFATTPAVREGAAMSAGLFLERCGTAVSPNAKDLFNYLLGFCSKVNTNNEAEALCATRLIAASISLWLGGRPSESVLTVVLQEIIEKMTSTSTPFDKKQVYLLVLPDLLSQLGSDAVHQVFDALFEALRTCGSTCNQTNANKIRADAAHVLRLMVDLAPAKLPTTCLVLVSTLITQSGNALCSVGTPCDHEALRSMMCCATLLLAILPREYCHVVPGSVQSQLSELCDVAFPKEAVFEPSSPSSPSRVPIDPLQKFELACLLESCLACSSGFGGLKMSLPQVTGKVAFILHGKELPTTQKSLIIALRSRASALQCLVSVLRFAKLSGKDISILTKLINQGIVTGLEDTLEILYHKSLPASNNQIEGLLCKARALAYEVIVLLPQLPKSVNLYMSVMKTCVGTITALSALGVVNTLAASTLSESLSLSGVRMHQGFVMGDAYQYGPNIELTTSQDTDWHHVICSSGAAPAQSNQVIDPYQEDCLLPTESIRLPSIVVLLNMAIRSLGIVFSRHGKGNKAVVIGRLKTQIQSTVSKRSNFEKDSPLQINILMGVVIALRCCLNHPSCRAILWNTDEELVKAGSGSIALAQLMFSSPCPLIRAASGEIIGLATALTGSTPSPIDAFLPTVLPKATLNESLSIAHTVGSLHCSDPKGRLDVVSLSISYLQNIWKSKCGSSSSDSSSGSASYLAEPIVLSTLSRIIQSCGNNAMQFAETALWFAVDALVSSTIDVDFRVLLAACGVAKSVIQTLGRNLSSASPVAAMVRAIILHGLRSDSAPVQSYCLSTLCYSIRCGFGSRLRLNLTHCTAQAVAVLNTCCVLSSEHLSNQHILSLVKMVHICCKVKPGTIVETVGPRHLLRLVDAVGSPQNLTLLLYAAGTYIITDTVDNQLRSGDPSERDRAKYRLLEWILECNDLVSIKAEKRVAQTQHDDSDDEEQSPSVSPSGGKEQVVPRLSTKCASVNFVVFLLELISHDVLTQPELQKWIAPHFESLLRSFLSATDDTTCSAFRTSGLKGLRSLVQLFKVIPDPQSVHDEDDDDDEIDPAVQKTQKSMLSMHETQLSSAARQGLDPANTGEVRCAAAMLTSELVVSCLLPRSALVRLLPQVTKWFSDTSDSLANVGSVAAVSRIFRFAQDLEEERKRNGIIVPKQYSITEAILSTVINDEGTITPDLINTAAVGHLRSYGLLCGLIDGWVLPVSRKDLLPRLQHGDMKDLIPYFMGVTCKRSENFELVCATAASLIEGYGNRKSHTQQGYYLGLDYLKEMLFHASDKPNAPLSHLLYEQFNKAENLREKATLLECLTGTQSIAKVVELTQTLQAVALTDKDAGVLRTVIRCQSKIATMTHNTSWLALVLQSIITILPLSDVSSSLNEYLREVGWTALTQISTSPGSNTLSVLRAFIQGLVSLKQTPASNLECYWYLLCSSCCLLKKVANEWSSAVDDLIGETLLSLKVTEITHLIAAIKEVKKQTEASTVFNNAGLKQLLITALTGGAAAICSNGMTADVVVPVAKLVSLSTYLLKDFCDDVEFSSVLVVSISSLSTSSDRKSFLSAVCNRCLYELVQKFSSHFRDLVPKLDPAVVTTMRGQIETQVRQVPTQQQQQQPRQQPSTGMKLSINADAFS